MGGGGGVKYHLKNIYIFFNFQLFQSNNKSIIFSFQAKDKESLMILSETLSGKGIDHKMWIEQPENFPTCIATKPYPKDEIQQYFTKFKLFK